MGKLIQLFPKAEPKMRAFDKPLLVSHFNDTVQQRADKDFRMRMERIKASLEKINRLMGELKYDHEKQ